jgi:hypothetical protein
MLKKVVSFLTITALLIQYVSLNDTYVYASNENSPKLFFSDMQSAPNSGWSNYEPNK